MNEEQNKTQQEDDGSLSFLNIPQDEANKHFNCKETTQQQLTNLKFWVCDYIENVKTKFGNERFLVKIKHEEPPSAEFETYLAEETKLQVKDNKQIFPVGKDHRDRHGRGIDFLGFVFYLNETRLRKRIKQNLCRKCAQLLKRKNPIDAKDFKQAIASWWGWCKYSDSDYFINKLNVKIQPYEIKFRHSPGSYSAAG